MTYEVKTEKSLFNGWTSETQILLEENVSNDPSINGKVGNRILEFTTLKRSGGGIVTNAMACILMNDGKFVSKETVIFQDYSKMVMNHGKIRATEKSIAQAHAAAFDKFAEHIESAKKQYNIA